MRQHLCWLCTGLDRSRQEFRPEPVNRLLLMLAVVAEYSVTCGVISQELARDYVHIQCGYSLIQLLSLRMRELNT